MADDLALLKPKEVAVLLGVHINTVKRMGDRGDLTYYRIGARGDRRYKRADIQEFLSRSQRGANPRLSAARSAHES